MHEYNFYFLSFIARSDPNPQCCWADGKSVTLFLERAPDPGSRAKSWRGCGVHGRSPQWLPWRQRVPVPLVPLVYKCRGPGLLVRRQVLCCPTSWTSSFFSPASETRACGSVSWAPGPHSLPSRPPSQPRVDTQPTREVRSTARGFG